MVQAAPALAVDETGRRQGRRRAWLWTAVASGATAFRIDRSRGAGALQALVGEPIGPVIISDRFPTYAWAPNRRVCWAHPRRDFQAMRVCRELLAAERSLWTFAAAEGVPPHNNAAERALRHGVIWRKVSGGTDSERGSRFVEQVLTVVATCRQRGRDVLDFLTGCFRSRLDGRSAPSLLG